MFGATRFSRSVAAATDLLHGVHLIKTVAAATEIKNRNLSVTRNGKSGRRGDRFNCLHFDSAEAPSSKGSHQEG